MKNNCNLPSKEVFDAWKQGKQLEWRTIFRDGTPSFDWVDNKDLFDATLQEGDWEAVEFRVKNVEVVRAWRPDEIPMGAIVRKMVGSGWQSEYLIVKRHGSWVTLATFEKDVTTNWLLNEGWECSKDNGKTWSICGVRE